MGSAIELGVHLYHLAEEHAAWSRATFGSDAERGPIGPLKHLEKEAREAQAKPQDRTEYADCLLLVLDASRRAGITPLDLILEARAKMKVNQTRSWPKTANDQPVEHAREEGK